MDRGKKLEKELIGKIKKSIEEIEKRGSELIAEKIVGSLTHQRCNYCDTQRFSGFSTQGPAGGEEICRLLFCNKCKVYYFDCYYDPFMGDDGFVYQQEITPEEAKAAKRAISKCKNPHNKYCSCKHHRRLRRILYKDLFAQMPKGGFNVPKEKKTLEEELTDMIVRDFRGGYELTTYDIVKYLRSQNSEFGKSYKASPSQGFDTVHKILENLREKSLLAKSITGEKLGNFSTVNYKWVVLERMCQRCGVHIKEHASGWWRVCASGKRPKKVRGRRQCFCRSPNCASCLLMYCKDENCKTHPKEKKEYLKKMYPLASD